jgi:predicted transcriptional regulator
MTLTALDLSEEEAAAYRALVATADPASAIDVASATDRSAGVMVRALRQLAVRGLARRAPGRVARYQPVDPQVAVKALIDDREQQLGAARSEMNQLAEVYRSASRREQPAGLVEVIEGDVNITRLYHRLVDAAHAQMRYFSRPPYFSNTPEDDPQQNRRMNDGIAFRVVYHTDALSTPDQLASIRRNVARGERARVTAIVPMEMMILDERQALIPLGAGTGSFEAAYLIHASSLLDALIALFESTWAHATPLYQAIDGHDDDGEGADRAALLTLLASGLTDKAIASHLGCSPRTLQRKLQSLYTELGTDTRFQAGVAATRRGWVTGVEAP